MVKHKDLLKELLLGVLHKKGMGVRFMSQFYPSQGYHALELAHLQNIGFTQREIQAFMFLTSLGNGDIKANIASQFGISPQEMQRLRYMKSIITGRVALETTDDISKHLRKMFGQHVRLNISNLPYSKVRSISRKALIAGIPKNSPFAVFNSNFKKDIYGIHLYNVENVRRDNMKIITNRHPVLKYGQKSEVENVLSVRKVTEKEFGIQRKSNLYELVISHRYARLCNRFAIVASMRKPEFHLGMIEIICLEGTKVYLYAANLGTGKSIGLRGGTQRIYYTGSFKEEIPYRIREALGFIFPFVCGVYTVEHPATEEYFLMPQVQLEDNEYDED